MRVLLSLTQLFHTVPGGTATSMVRLAKELDRRSELQLGLYGARGSVRSPATMVSPQKHLQGWQLPDRWDTAALPVQMLYASWRRWGSPQPRSIRRGQMDLFHLTVPVVPPSLHHNRRRSPQRIPLVATVHDVIPLQHPDRFTQRGADLMVHGLTTLRERADCIIVPTHHVANQCLEHGFDSDRLRVIHHGVDPMPIQHVDLSHLNLPKDFALFVGTKEPRKNLDRLIQALAELAANGIKIPLVIVGPDGWGDQPNEQLPGVDVINVGRLTSAQVQAIYPLASVFVFPSLDEGFGLPVLEAMAGGVPVVTSQDSAMSEVSNGAAALCDPQDSSSIASAIESVLTSSQRTAALRSAGLQRAAELTWARAAEATSTVYHEVMGALGSL